MMTEIDMIDCVSTYDDIISTNQYEADQYKIEELEHALLCSQRNKDVFEERFYEERRKVRVLEAKLHEKLTDANK